MVHYMTLTSRSICVFREGEWIYFGNQFNVSDCVRLFVWENE